MQRTTKLLANTITAALCLGANIVHAEDEQVQVHTVDVQMHAQDENPWLLGSWGGQRAALAEKGLSFEVVATVDVLADVSGGLRRRTATPATLDAVMTLDTGAAGWWQNGTLNVYLLGTAGADTNDNVGALQVASNIEAPNTFKVYEAWYEQRFFDDKFSVLVGLHDLNSEFYVTDLSGMFINSSFGNGQEIAQVGPSIFPTTAVAGRLRFAPTEHTYIMGAVYDGVPGDPNDAYGTHIQFNKGDGVLTIGEIGVTGGAVGTAGAERYFKLAFGGWNQTQFDNMITGAREDNTGFYTVGEMDLWRGEDGRGLGMFGQLGFAQSDRTQTDFYGGGGLNWTGPFASRAADVFGVAYAQARNGDDFLHANPGFENAETVVEVTYQVDVMPGVMVQPDLQYFITPGTDPTISDAVVVGLRVQIEL